MRPTVDNTALSVLVVSCDKFSDVWSPFFTLFWKYWPDCPYKVYLGSNTISMDDPRVTMLRIGPDRGWSSSVRKMMARIPTTYVMLILEDWLLKERVDSAKIAAIFQQLVELNGGYLRLDPAGVRPDRHVDGMPMIGEIDRGAPYRVSLHIAIWRRDTLLTLLKEDESAWDMEILGSRRSDTLTEGFYATWSDTIQYDKGGVHQGKWTPSAIRHARREGIQLNFAARGKYTFQDTVRRSIKKVVNIPRSHIPWRVRRPVRSLLWRLGLVKTRL